MNTFTKTNGKSRLARTVARIGVGVVMLGLIVSQLSAARAQDAPLMRLKETATIDTKGDCKFEADIKLPARLYTLLKKNNPNVALMLRKFGLGGQMWYQIEDIKGNFEDGTSTIHITCTTRGFARMGKDHLWELPVADTIDAELVSAHDNEAVLTAALNSEIGMATVTSRIVLPRDSKDIKLLKSPARLAFRMPAPTTADGSRSSGDLTLEVKPQVMSALGKSYGNAKFQNLWVARSVFKNTGDETLNNYQVRFRVVDYTSTWGPWSRVEQVVPGQTVVDAYFPVLDLEKLAKLNGNVPAMLEVEYQYKQADGQLVKETETKTLKILGHNEVFYSSLKPDDIVDWQDQFNLGPIILASFVTHDDPVIGQVAGWVSGQAGGPAQALKDEDARAFMKALYDFMVINKIAYQTSPGGITEGQLGQHVKYGRDVLKNRAGTCIDLAIFYASVCDAVGLQSIVYLVQGHAFPAVILPQSGNIVPVEATFVDKNPSFNEANKFAVQEVIKWTNDGRMYRVEIRKLHDQGVSGLELPNLPEDVLTKWGIRKVEIVPASANNQQQPAPRNNNQQPAPSPAPTPNPTPAPNPVVRPHTLVGTWDTSSVVSGRLIHKTVTFDARGNFRIVISAGRDSQEVTGIYAYTQPTLMLMAGANLETGTITWVNGDRIKYSNGTVEETYERRR